jgi:preprotein translocase, secE subunit
VTDMAKGFFKGVKGELKKVVWPTKKQLINNTVMVIALVLAFSIIVLGFDLILEKIDGSLWNFITNKIG